MCTQSRNSQTYILLRDFWKKLFVWNVSLRAEADVICQLLSQLINLSNIIEAPMIHQSNIKIIV